MFGGKRRGEGKEWRGVGGRIPTGKEGMPWQGPASAKPPPHCAIALWLKIAVDELLRRRRENTRWTNARSEGACEGVGLRGTNCARLNKKKKGCHPGT